GAVGLQDFEKLRRRAARVDDVLHQQDILSGEDGVRLKRHPDGTGRLRAGSVAFTAQKLDAERKVDGAGEVGRENETALEDAGEYEILAGVIPCDHGT